MPEFSGLGRLLITLGALLLVAGLLITALGALGLGRLPGDIVWRRGNFTLFFPLATSILLSLLLTIILNIIARR